MIVRKQVLGVLATGALLLSGCAGDGTGEVELTVVATQSAALEVGVIVGEGADAIAVNRLELQLREIKILPDSS